MASPRVGLAKENISFCVVRSVNSICPFVNLSFEQYRSVEKPIFIYRLSTLRDSVISCSDMIVDKY